MTISLEVLQPDIEILTTAKDQKQEPDFQLVPLAGHGKPISLQVGEHMISIVNRELRGDRDSLQLTELVGKEVESYLIYSYAYGDGGRVSGAKVAPGESHEFASIRLTSS